MAKVELQFGELGGGQYKFEYVGVPSQATINVGFKPKQLFLQLRYNGSVQRDMKDFYDVTVSPTQITHIADTTSSTVSIGSGSTFLFDIVDNGFVLGWGSSGSDINKIYQMAYLAIG